MVPSCICFFFQVRPTKHLTSHHSLWSQGINVKAHVKVASQSSLANRRSLSIHPHNICMWVKRIYFHCLRHCMRLEFEELPDMVMITIWLIFSILLLQCINNGDARVLIDANLSQLYGTYQCDNARLMNLHCWYVLQINLQCTNQSVSRLIIDMH